jgi:hypothetical protein
MEIKLSIKEILFPSIVQASLRASVRARELAIYLPLVVWAQIKLPHKGRVAGLAMWRSARDFSVLCPSFTNIFRECSSRLRQ